ncbi:MAG TPA: calcium-binding protein [Rhizomicrobium sp.]|jgi:hypothetical protein
MAKHHVSDDINTSTYYIINASNSIYDPNHEILGALHLGAGDSALITSDGYVIAGESGTTGVYLDAYTSGSVLTVDGLVSSQEIGVYSLGTGNHIDIKGDVYGGIEVEGASTDVTIEAGGFVSGETSISGQYSQFVNYGIVNTDFAGFQIDNGAGVTNFGTISGGFFFTGDGTNETFIANYGTVTEGLSVYYQDTNAAAALYVDNEGHWGGDVDTTPGDDTVINHGTIDGNVSLGDGNNTLDSRSGMILGGSITSGDGNDTIYGGSEDDIIEAGAGTDYIDGGGGNNTMIYEESARGIYIDLGKGIARHGNAQGDTLLHIQNITGTLKADTLIGDSNDNVLNGVLGNDVLQGNDGNDTLVMYGKAYAILQGGNGNDTILLQSANAALYGDAFTAKDTIDGGAGYDTVSLIGAANVTFTATTMINVERIVMSDGFSYHLNTNDATVAAGQNLEVDASSLTSAYSLIFNGGAETNGTFNIEGGDGKDNITGGAGNDYMAGNGQADTLKGGSGVDHFVYYDPTDSSGPTFDTIVAFNASQDLFALPVDVANLDPEVDGGTLGNGSNFNTDLHNALQGHLLAGDAIIYKPNAGYYAGHTFLVIDANGSAGYQANGDYVMDITGYTGTLALSDFGH